MTRLMALARRMTRPVLMTICAACLLPGQPPPPENLQVLPKDMPRQEVMRTMRGFTQGLGVQCDFCHVGREFAKDDKEEKKTARAMMRMVMSLKDHGDEFLPAGKAASLGCWTCHRGSAHIETPPAPPAGGPGRGPGGPPPGNPPAQQ